MKPLDVPHGDHPSRTLFVRNVTPSARDDDLWSLFVVFGDIMGLYTSCKHRGFILVTYFDIRAAKGAMQGLQDKYLNGAKLAIKFSIPIESPIDKGLNQGTLVVFNIDTSISMDHLKCIFSMYGEVKEIRETPRKKHHKFIEFFDIRHAVAALHGLNRTELAGKRIKIEISRPGGARKILTDQLSEILAAEEQKPPLADAFFVEASHAPKGLGPGGYGAAAAGGLPGGGGFSLGDGGPSYLGGGFPSAAPPRKSYSKSVAGGSFPGEKGASHGFSPDAPSYWGRPGPGEAAGLAGKLELPVQSQPFYSQGGMAPSLRQSFQGQPYGGLDRRGSRRDRGSRGRLDGAGGSREDMYGRRPKVSSEDFVLDPSKIASGLEVRTTIMIKNIPNKYTQKMLLNVIDEASKGKYDFFYLPIDFKNKCNVGYAFLNLKHHSHILPLYEQMNGKKWTKFNSEKICCITYGRIQGLSALVSHFQRSSLLHEDKRCRPLLFTEAGGERGVAAAEAMGFPLPEVGQALAPPAPAPLMGAPAPTMGLPMKPPPGSEPPPLAGAIAQDMHAMKHLVATMDFTNEAGPPAEPPAGGGNAPARPLTEVAGT